MCVYVCVCKRAPTNKYSGQMGVSEGFSFFCLYTAVLIKRLLISYLYKIQTRRRAGWQYCIYLLIALNTFAAEKVTCFITHVMFQ